jgi:hypothetical protein
MALDPVEGLGASRPTPDGRDQLSPKSGGAELRRVAAIVPAVDRLADDDEPAVRAPDMGPMDEDRPRANRRRPIANGGQETVMAGGNGVHLARVPPCLGTS